MARPREFVTDEVVTKALAAFWLRGYHAMSIDDVLSSIGVGRQSFYNAFTDKRTLFGMCLVRYRDQQLATLAGYFEAKPTVYGGFAALFESIVAEPDANKRRGCLMLNAASELAITDVEIADLASAYQLSIEDLFAAQLVRGLAGGTSFSGHTADDARRKSRLLVAVYLGLRSMAKADPRSTAIADAVKLAIEQVQTLVGVG
jgi:TetR/AcrR family transcriptional regulator, transcriptional repressor for nem operon